VLKDFFNHIRLVDEADDYPSVKGVQTVLQWSKHPKAKDADPTRFIERKFVESLDKQLAK